MMSWEHSLLGDLDPALIQAAAQGDGRAVDGYRELLGELGRAPRQVDEARLLGSHPGLEIVRLPGSGLAGTAGGDRGRAAAVHRPADPVDAQLGYR